jgi:hypothetical protein
MLHRGHFASRLAGRDEKEGCDMGKTFMPTTLGGLLAFAQAFSSQISAAAASFGVPTATATSLATVTSAYASAYGEATNESTRTRGKVAAMHTAARNLRAVISDVSKLVYGTSTVTDEQLLDLGLTVRSAPSPIPPVALSPKATVNSVTNNVVRYTVLDRANEATRRKPANARGLLALTYCGDVPPTSTESGWNLQGVTGRNGNVAIAFPTDTPPGTKCWATFMWIGTRGEFSPACDPIFAYLQVGPGSEEEAA